jgi:hypothetical protein
LPGERYTGFAAVAAGTARDRNSSASALDANAWAASANFTSEASAVVIETDDISDNPNTATSGAAYPLVNMRINQMISGPELVAVANIAAGPCFRQQRQSVAQGSAAHLQIALKATGSAAI